MKRILVAVLAACALALSIVGVRAGTLYDLVRMTTPTTGANNVVALGVAVPGFLTFSGAGVPDGSTVSIAIQDTGGSPVQSLSGRGVYSASGQTVTVTQITASTNAGAMIPLSGSAQIAISPITLDLETIDAGGGTTGTSVANAPSGDCLFANGTKVGPQGCRALIPSLAVYVNPTGGTTSSDTYDCLAPTWAGGSSTHGPCQTIQRAISAGYSYDAGGGNLGNATVNLSAGSFPAGAVIINEPVGLGAEAVYFSIVGAGSGSTTVADTGSGCGAFIIGNHASVLFKGITITKASGCGSSGSGIFVQNFALVEIGPDVILGNAEANGQLVHIEAHGMVEISSNLTLAGSANAAFGLSNLGYLETDSITISCVGSLSFPGGFISAQSNSVAFVSAGATFSDCGSVSGPRYNLSSHATLDLNGNLSLSIPPGNASGLVLQDANVYPTPGVTLSACTNGTVTPTSNRNQGLIGFSGSSSTCTVLFNVPYSNAPSCVVSQNNSTAALQSGAQPNFLGITGTWTNDSSVNYICYPNPN